MTLLGVTLRTFDSGLVRYRVSGWPWHGRSASLSQSCPGA
jgi:hypothetical protein